MTAHSALGRLRAGSADVSRYGWDGDRPGSEFAARGIIKTLLPLQIPARIRPGMPSARVPYGCRLVRLIQVFPTVGG
jgi:hypothetical protein